MVHWRIGKKIKPVVILDKPEQRNESPGNWQGPNDVSGKIFVTQDADNIYIAAEVRDDKPLWNPRSPVITDSWWKITYDGDALRVKVITSTATTDLFLFPGAFGIHPQIYIHKSTLAKSGTLTEGEIVSSYTEKYSGYSIESRIPKSVLGLTTEQPLFQFELFDGDGTANSCKSLISKPVTIPRKNKKCVSRLNMSQKRRKFLIPRFPVCFIKTAD